VSGQESGLTIGLKWHTYGQPPETDFDELLAVAREADELGYHGLFPVDHLLMPSSQILGFSAIADPERPYFPEPWTALAAAAAVTRQIRLGPQVTPLSLRHPVFVAWMGATLDRISHGRVILQVGAGWMRREYESFGFPWQERLSDRVTTMLDGIATVERLWTESDPITQENGAYPLREAVLWPKPLQRPRPPIWLGGTSQMLRRATGVYGDGWCPALFSVPGGPTGYPALFDEIRAAADAAGRDPESIVPGGLVYLVLDKSRERAHARAELLRRRDDWAGLSTVEIDSSHRVVIGSPDDCRKRLQCWLDAGLTHLTVGLLPIQGREATLDDIRLFAEEVMPKLELQIDSQPSAR
jgi:alkanesulfonate monooxygenase SsuD/methylene tetrahydromethanopterin reductase-like flavin-dependent oxidoreductase (luciferase family)